MRTDHSNGLQSVCVWGGPMDTLNPPNPSPRYLTPPDTLPLDTLPPDNLYLDTLPPPLKKESRDQR